MKGDVMLFVPRCVVIATALMGASAAFAQTPAAAAPETADRFFPSMVGIGGQACTDLITAPKQPWQLACYVTGTADRFGRVAPASVQCQGDPSYTDRVRSCFSTFHINSLYFGYRGPICVAVLFNVHPSGMAPPNQLSRQINAKEVYPCEDRPAQMKDPDDFKPGSGPPPKSKAKFDLKYESCIPARNRREISATCLTRVAIDGSGKPVGQTRMTCSDPTFQMDAAACLKAVKLKPEYKSSPPPELCLRIDFWGEAKKETPLSPSLDKSPPLSNAFPKPLFTYPVGVSELKACPDSLFEE